MPINLGQITFGIGADTTRLRSSINDITNFGAAVTAAAQNANTAGTVVEASFRRQEAAMISALQKVQRYQDSVGRLRAPANLAQGLNTLSTRGLDLLVQRMSSGQLTALQFQREMERFNVTMNNAQRIMGNWAAAQKQAKADEFSNALRKLSSTATLVAGPLSGIATRISVVSSLAEHFSLAWAGTVAGIAAGTYAFIKLSSAIINTERSLQQYSSTLTAVYNSQTIANLQFSYLADLASKTGANFGTLAHQYSQIQAAAKGTSLEGERVRDVFESVVFAGQKLGLTNEELEGSLKAIQQMISKGTVQMEELKGQLGDRLPGAVQIFAQGLGVTTMKLQQMIKNGEVGASSLVKFAQALRERYNIDTSAKIDTIAAAEGRLSVARMAAIDQLDKIIGVSGAYKNALNYIADGLTGASSNSRALIQQLLQLGAAFAAAFAGPLILSGLSALVTGIMGLARAIATVNAASALGALTSFARVMAVLAVATAAYYGSEQLINKALGQTTDSFLKAKPAVEDYIKAQQTLVSSVRQPTRDYIKEQESLLDSQIKQRNDLADSMKTTLEWADTLEKAGVSTSNISKQLANMGMPSIDAADAQVKKLDASIEATKKNISDLNAILRQQDKAENNPRPDPTKDLTTRQEVTIKKAEEQIRNLKEKYNNLFLSPAAKQYADTQEEVNHQVETFKENLERAEIPAEKIAKLTADFRKNFQAFKDGENAIKNMTSAFEVAADVFGRAANTGLTNFVDVLVDGKDKAEALADTVRAVAKDILNTMIKLAALNPLKNMLFGTNEQVLGGNAGFGGAMGSLFGGGGGFNFGSLMGSAGITYGLPGTSGSNLYGPVAPMANGGIMTSMGSMPLRTYARGGIATGPQAAIFGEGSHNEAFVPLPDGRRIPVAMSGGVGGGGTEVHIHPPSGHDTKQSSSTTGSGGVRLDVEFVKMHRAAMLGDIAEGGPISTTMERQFGLNRAKGLSS